MSWPPPYFHPLTACSAQLACRAGRVLLVAGLGVLLAGCSGKTMKRTVIDGYKGEALKNPFLALERLLDVQGIPYEDSLSLDHAKDPDSLLIVPAELEASLVSPILKEISRRGGHVVFFLNGTYRYGNDHTTSFSAATGHKEYQNEILEQLKIKLADDQAPSGPASPVPSTTPPAAGISASFPHQSFNALPYRNAAAKPYKLVGKDVGLLHAGLVPPGRVVWSAYKDRQSTPAITLRHGVGKVTVFATASPFRNISLTEGDNALFFLDFLQLAEKWRIYFFLGKQPTLLGLLAERYGKALLGVVVLVALWLWHRVPRFGPLLQANPVSTIPRFSQHLELSGHFLWKRGQSGHLLNGLRNAILQQLRLRHAPLLALDDEDLVPRLAQMCGLPLDRMDAAWACYYESDPTKFTNYSRDLQAVLTTVQGTRS